MSAVTTMTHRTSIRRDSGTATTSSGGVTPSWSTVASNVKCRAWPLTDRGLSREAILPEENYVTKAKRVICPLTIDVTERDQLGNITDRRGTVLFPGPLNVQTVARRKDHLELLVMELAS